MTKNDQLDNTLYERKILEQINHPFLVNLEYAFQTNSKIFFVMKYMQGGELFFHLHSSFKRRFSEELTRFYAVQIISAIGYLHKKNIIYRDLKPENIVLDLNGYIKITDFGLAKFLKPNQITYSFAGTADYMSPEII